MNTLRELYDAVNAIMPETDLFSIDIEVWQYRNGGGGIRLLYKIWDGHHSHVGSTPDAALANLKDCITPNQCPGALDEIELPDKEAIHG